MLSSRTLGRIRLLAAVIAQAFPQITRSRYGCFSCISVRPLQFVVRRGRWSRDRGGWERRLETARAREARELGLDETRRIAYMALASRETERYELVATIVNARAHRGAEIDVDQALRNVTAVVKGGPGKAGESETWLRSQINRITADVGPEAQIPCLPPRPANAQPANSAVIWWCIVEP